MPLLLATLGSPDAQAGALAAEGLGAIGGTAAADGLAQAARSNPAGRVRSEAAAALARLGDPRAVPLLVATLLDDPDVLHSDLSTSAIALISLGPPVVPAVLPLLRSADPDVRRVGHNVLRMIANARAGWEELVLLLNAYDPAAPAEQRDRAAAAAETWIAGHPMPP